MQIRLGVFLALDNGKDEDNDSKAKVKLIPANETGNDPVYGSLTLVETSQGVYIRGKILGLEKGLHGFHVHAVGDTGNNCKAAGGHFNPHEVSLTRKVIQIEIKYFLIF